MPESLPIKTNTNKFTTREDLQKEFFRLDNKWSFKRGDLVQMSKTFIDTQRSLYQELITRDDINRILTAQKGLQLEFLQSGMGGDEDSDPLLEEEKKINGIEKLKESFHEVERAFEELKRIHSESGFIYSIKRWVQFDEDHWDPNTGFYQPKKFFIQDFTTNSDTNTMEQQQAILIGDDEKVCVPIVYIEKCAEPFNDNEEPVRNEKRETGALQNGINKIKQLFL